MKKGWQIAPLGSLCTVRNGKSDTQDALESGEFVFFDRSKTIKRSSRFLFNCEALIIPGEGKEFLPRHFIGKFDLHQRAYALHDFVDNINVKYLYYYLHHRCDYLPSVAVGATVKSLRMRHFEEFPVAITAPDDQQRIVAILDEAFDGIATAKANAEKNLQNARDLFESVLDSVHGESAPLGNYVTIKTGKLDANAAIEDGAYPFFTCAKEIYAIDKYAFDCEAILLAGNNAVGDFNVKHYSGKFNAYQRTYVITVLDEDLLSYRFLYFQMLKSLKRFKEQSVGAGTKFLKLGMIKELEISLPPIAKQLETASMLDSLLKETQRLESIYQQKLTALDDLKKSLLHQAFSGNL